MYELKPRDTFIGKNGNVKNALVAPGVKIDGYVENSFIFENTIVREGAKILNSVVLPGHTIGKKALLENCLILPFYGEAAPGTTIGDKSIIGGISKSANKLFPEHMQSGLTIIGYNVEVPGNTVIEPSSCIDWGVTKNDVKQKKNIKKGSFLSLEG